MSDTPSRVGFAHAADLLIKAPELWALCPFDAFTANEEADLQVLLCAGLVEICAPYFCTLLDGRRCRATVTLTGRFLEEDQDLLGRNLVRAVREQMGCAAKDADSDPALRKWRLTSEGLLICSQIVAGTLHGRALISFLYKTGTWRDEYHPPLVTVENVIAISEGSAPSADEKPGKHASNVAENWDALACGLLLQHRNRIKKLPDLHPLLKQAGYQGTKQALYKMKALLSAAEAAGIYTPKEATGKAQMRRGHKTRDGRIEAEDDCSEAA